MGLYAGLTDCTDPVVTVEETDLEAADRLVTTLLRNRSVDPADVTDPDGLALLRDLAVAYATTDAARRGAHDADAGSVMWAKHKSYRDRARDLAQMVNRESLGLAATGSGAAGYAAIPMGRG
jgi:hypothetical protein